MKYYVIINGESSLDIQGLVISKLPDISKPLMRNEKIEIDGRDGDIITKLGYSAYDKTIEIGLWGTYDINTIIEYFNQDGVITFSNEIDKYYNFSILNREDFINKLEKFKTASITLHCQPFKYEVNEETKEIENEYVERTGTSISLSNTLSAPMEIDLKGNTKQDTLSGKNKLPFTNQDFTLNNVRYYAQNGNLYLDGTSTGETGSTNANFKNNFSFYLSAGTYIFNSKKLDANQPMYIRNYATNDALAMINGNTIRTATFTLTETTQCYLSFYVYQKVFSNMNLEMQLEQGSTPTSYEQYCGGIPSPNPDYPQDVNVVSGNNNVVVSGKNKLNITDFTETKNGITLTVVGNQIKLNGTATGYTEFYLTTTPYIISSGTYTFSINKISGTIENNSGNTTLYNTLRNNNNSNLQQIRIKEGAEVNTNTYSGEETISKLMISSSNGVKYTNYIYNLQLEEGNQATSYEPYTETTYPINLPVKNIMNIPDGTGTRENNTFTALNQEITINSNTSGTESAFYFNDVSQVSRYANSYSNARDYNMTSTGGTYTLTTYFSYRPEYNFQVYLYTNKRLTKRTTNDNWDNGKLVNTITLDSDEYIKSIQCYMPAALVFDNLKITAQLEEGSNTNAYHPYGTTPIELCKIGTYQDYFYKDSGKWYLHKETFNITLDGTESSWSIGNGGWYSQSFINEIKPSSQAISNKYAYTTNTWQGNYTFSINASGFIAISDNRYPVRTDWINYLINNNVDMLCVLDTPTNTEITDTTLIEQLEAIASATSYEGETNINQVNNDLPFIITASIFTGTDTITIENKGNTTAKPTMTIYGKGTIGVYLNGNQVFTINLGDEEYITIDTQNMEASKDTILKNRLVVGDYNSFVLQTGNNTLKFTGLVDKVEINNYSRWV